MAARAQPAMGAASARCSQARDWARRGATPGTRRWAGLSPSSW